MTSAISIGKQDFASLRENHYFYVDKTDFIRQWWESGDDITLITRPRRFGKTLNMSMLNCFFSRQYAEKGTIFEGLSIWKQEKYRRLQGTYPVIFLSFADVKQNNYQDAVQKIKNIIVDAYVTKGNVHDSGPFIERAEYIKNKFLFYWLLIKTPIKIFSFYNIDYQIRIHIFH